MVWLIAGAVVVVLVLLGLVRAAEWLIAGNHWEDG